MEYIYNGESIMIGREEGAYTIYIMASTHTVLKELTVAKEEVIDAIETEFKNLEEEIGSLFGKNKKLKKKISYEKTRNELEEIKRIL